MFCKKLSVAIRGGLALLLAALSFALVVPAYAADVDPSMKVSYGDLNLETEAGAQALLQRIKHAARLVCDDAVSPEDQLHINHWWRCYDTAVSNAVDQVHSAKLTARYAQSGHRRAG
jgi:UrcA family protein